MTDDKKPTEIQDDDLEQVDGGAIYLKLGDIDGTSKTVNSFNLTMKRGTVDAAGDALPTEDFSMNYEKIKVKY